MQSLLNRAKKLYPDSYVIHEGSLAGCLILVKNTNWCNKDSTMKDVKFSDTVIVC